MQEASDKRREKKKEKKKKKTKGKAGSDGVAAEHSGDEDGPSSSQQGAESQQEAESLEPRSRRQSEEAQGIVLQAEQAGIGVAEARGSGGADVVLPSRDSGRPMEGECLLRKISW